MTTSEQLTEIIALLRELVDRLPRRYVRKKLPVVADCPVPESTLLEYVKSLKPGFYSSIDIAKGCGISIDKASITSMNYALEAAGVRAAKSGSRRGFRIGAWKGHVPAPGGF